MVALCQLERARRELLEAASDPLAIELGACVLFSHQEGCTAHRRMVHEGVVVELVPRRARKLPEYVIESRGGVRIRRSATQLIVQFP